MYIAGQNTKDEASFYQYNGLNQLTKSIVADKTVTYEYNANGLRTSKTVNGAKTTQVWDGDQIALELNALGVVTNKYVRGINLIYSDDGNGSNKKFYVFNGHGDVVQLTDTTGTVTKSYNYDAFGNEKNIDANDTNVFRYCGEYFDKETGTIYLRARYYDPGIGRFISEDSYEGKDNDPLSLNLYTYCINNPIMFEDPSGHRNVVIVVGADKASNNNAFMNNPETYKKDNPNDTVIIIKAWDYDKDKALMKAISNAYGNKGVDALIIESHGNVDTPVLYVTGSYTIIKSTDWAGVKFNSEANIRLTGCNTAGWKGEVSSNSIAQSIADKTGVTVWGYVNSTSQVAYDKNGNVTNEWRKAVKYYQKPIRSTSGEKVVNSLTRVNPTPKPAKPPKVWYKPWTWFN